MSPYTRTNRAVAPIPFSCAECKAAGSPNGTLVFPVDGEYPTPECRYHKDPIPMARSKHYDETGTRIKGGRE